MYTNIIRVFAGYSLRLLYLLPALTEESYVFGPESFL
jgi:hypothetical protein